MRTIAGTLLVMIAISGCLGNLDSDDLPETTRALAGHGAQPVDGKTISWDGRQINVDYDDRDYFEFELELTPGFWSANDGGVEVSVHWDTLGYYLQDPADVVDLQLVVYDGAGAVVGGNDACGPFPPGLVCETVFDSGVANCLGCVSTSRVLIIDDLASGVYRVEVIARSGSTSYTGVVQVEATPVTTEVKELLPNLVTLPPSNFAIEVPRIYGAPVPQPVGPKGCLPTETALDDGQPLRCLRFDNLVGNSGAGNFLLWMDDSNSVTALAGEGELMQRILASDGSFRDVAAGQSTFHAMHTHFHVNSLTHFSLYVYDVEGGARGDLALDVRKNGWNPAHTGLMDPFAYGTALASSGCVHLAEQSTGLQCLDLAPGWYDAYTSELFEQYLDISDLPDGVYELVSEVNVQGTLVESNVTDNAASAMIRITGDVVEELRTDANSG